MPRYLFPKELTAQSVMSPNRVDPTELNLLQQVVADSVGKPISDVTQGKYGEALGGLANLFAKPAAMLLSPTEAEGATQNQIFDSVVKLLRKKAESESINSKPTEMLLEAIRSKAPASLEAYRPEVLAKEIYNTQTYRPNTSLVISSPSKFLSAASKLDRTDQRVATDINHLKEMLSTRKNTPGQWNDNFYIDRYGNDFNGFTDVPYLEVTGGGKVRGHEGRHRNYALSDLFGADTPIAQKIYTTSYQDLPQIMRMNNWMTQQGAETPVMESLRRFVDVPNYGE